MSLIVEDSQHMRFGQSPNPSLIGRLCLGTVQFGLDYGINNQSGQVKVEEVQKILRLAGQQGIRLLDTAAAYGDSERVLGQSSLGDFRIVSKLAKDATAVSVALETSLRRLGVQKLYGYLVHDFDSYRQRPAIWEEMLRLKQLGKIQKPGFSLYHPQQLESLWAEGIHPELLQIPYNLFDRRFESLMGEMRARKIEIHTRSAFLQGLFFKKAEHLSSHFEAAKAQLADLHQLSEVHYISIAHLCLGFCLSQSAIDQVVIGVDNTAQLQANLDVVSCMPKLKQLSAQLEALRLEDASIINPSNWDIP